jgi:hypothetical protein
MKLCFACFSFVKCYVEKCLESERDLVFKQEIFDKFFSEFVIDPFEVKSVLYRYNRILNYPNKLSQFHEM